MKHYEPRPNSIPTRVIAHLTDHPDEWFTDHVLGSVVDQLPKLMKQTLAPAIRRGLILFEVRDGRGQFKLGNGHTLPPRDEEDEEDKIENVRKSTKGHGYGIGRVATVFGLGDLALGEIAQAGPAELESAKAAPAEAPKPAPKIEPKPDPDKWIQAGNARFALWDDGTIQIETADESVKLSRAESKSLANLIRGTVL